MIGRYNRLPPEEQRIVLTSLFGVAASLWLAVAWEEPMALLAVPLLAVGDWLLIRMARRRADRDKEELLY